MFVMGKTLNYRGQVLIIRENLLFKMKSWSLGNYKLYFCSCLIADEQPIHDFDWEEWVEMVEGH